jgi:hypothetical protein
MVGYQAIEAVNNGVTQDNYCFVKVHHRVKGVLTLQGQLNFQNGKRLRGKKPT